jgi:hypothetical protein
VRITLETLLKPVSNAVIVVFRFDDRDRDVRLLVEATRGFWRSSIQSRVGTTIGSWSANKKLQAKVHT